MELSVKEFLDSVFNSNTRKGYRVGIKKFYEWFERSPREILEARKDDLTQRPGEDLIEYRNRAARFEREIEKFHGYLLKQGYMTNTARCMTIGILQLFRYYQMPIRMRGGRVFPVENTRIQNHCRITGILNKVVCFTLRNTDIIG